MKTKFQLTDTISGLRTTKLNVTTHLFQMKNKKRMSSKLQYKYLSKQRNAKQECII